MKKIVALLLVLAMTLALAACGQDKTPAASNGTDTKDTKPASTGDTVKVAFETNRLHFFDKDTELSILNR